MERGWYEDVRGSGRVDFVIGMRWRALWRLIVSPWVSWWFVKMVRSDPEVGLERTRVRLRRRGPVVLQRWESRKRLDAWARDPRQAHAPSWARFRRSAGGTAEWGIWHEIRPAGGTGAGSPVESDHAPASLAAQTA